MLARHIQGGSNMTGTDYGLFTHKSVAVIFEPPSIICVLFHDTKVYSLPSLDSTDSTCDRISFVGGLPFQASFHHRFVLSHYISVLRPKVRGIFSSRTCCCSTDLVFVHSLHLAFSFSSNCTAVLL